MSDTTKTPKDKKEKYGNVDSLLNPTTVPETKTETETAARKRRPAPALSALQDNIPTSSTDVLKKQIDELKERLNTASESTKPIAIQMPVTKQTVAFELMEIDPDKIDVSPENERIQGFLDEISLNDILPSIKKHGQQKPGTLRPKNDGRYELIEGSRRLAAVKLAKHPYLALVGDVPDADVRELSTIENKHQDVSPYEKAVFYNKLIQKGEFETWSQLGAAKGISSTHISRFKACVDLDELFVRILPSPSDMPLSYGETIRGLLKKDKASLVSKAKEIFNQRSGSLQNKASRPDVEEIIKLLKSSVRSRAAQKPTLKRPVIYTGKNSKTSLKHSVTSSGSTKIELSGFDPSQIDKLLSQIRASLDLG